MTRKRKSRWLFAKSKSRLVTITEEDCFWFRPKAEMLLAKSKSRLKNVYLRSRKISLVIMTFAFLEDTCPS